jgi:hypothetical protein
MATLPASWTTIPATHVFVALEQVVDARVKPEPDESSTECAASTGKTQV